MINQGIQRTIGLSLRDVIESSTNETLIIQAESPSPAIMWISNDDVTLNVLIKMKVMGKDLTITIKAQEQFEIPFIVEEDTYEIKIEATTVYRCQIYV